MEINTEKTKLMTNSANGIQREIKVKWQKLGTITSSSSSEQLFQMMAQNQRFSLDAIGAVCHQFGLLSIDLHLIPCSGFVETFN